MFTEIINANDFSSLKDDSAMIQAAVDKAADTGCAVVIPHTNSRTGRSFWEIKRTINLYTGSVIYLENCRLRLADDAFCNIFKNSHARTDKALKYEGRQFDIKICGFGNAVLDGGNHNGYTEATIGFPEIISNTMIHFHNVERVAVENLRIVDHRWWGMTFHYCSQGNISNIQFECSKNFMNMDGIDLRTGCNHFTIENLSGVTGDDMVALTNIPICSLYDVEGLDDSLHTIFIRNIRAKLYGNHAIVRLLNQGGRKLYNIQISNILDCSEPGEELHRPYAAVRIGDMYYNYDKPMAKLGDTHGIIIRDVTTRAINGVYAACTLQDAVIDGLQLYGDAGTGICFNNADCSNISVNNLQYSANAQFPESDRGRIIQTTDDRMQKLAGVYFHNSKCKNLNISGMTMGNGADAVFAGTGSSADISLLGLRMAGAEIPLKDGDGIFVEKTVV